jgi:hypothetical protein
MGIYALVIPFDTVTWASDEFSVKDYVGYVSLGEVVISFRASRPSKAFSLVITEDGTVAYVSSALLTPWGSSSLDVLNASPIVTAWPVDRPYPMRSSSS